MLSRVAGTTARVWQSPLVKTRAVIASNYSSAAAPVAASASEVEIPETLNKYDSLVVFHPPLVAKVQETVAESLEEVKQGEPLADQLTVRFGENMPTLEDEKHPERDLVNFPRMKTLIEPEGTRLLVIPESWCKFMYEKTGHSGPYAFFGGLTAFLFSKEWLIYEHEMHVGVAIGLITLIVMKNYGRQFSDYLEDITNTEELAWNNWQNGTINVLQQYIDMEKKHQESLKGQKILFDAKRENIHLQREAEYRRRLMAVHNEVKRKLDYQVATQNTSKQFAQKHMVSWVIDNVTKGISAQQEKEALSKCIADLKALAAKKANVI
ncbi:ATP synthase subunit b, mitochondrial [Halotydeus destructor]|nr:ATP synthase subunit b, mitochondrial [Halotydeus destructor]